MKLSSLSAFLLFCAVTSAEMEQQGRRKLEETNDINFIGDACVDYYISEDATWDTWESPSTSGNIQTSGPSKTVDTTLEIYSGRPNQQFKIFGDGWVTAYRGGTQFTYDPFIGEIHTHDTDDGIIRYKVVDGERFAVIYDEVLQADDPNGSPYHNTFQVVFSSVTSKYPQITFCYETMNWHLPNYNYPEIGVWRGTTAYHIARWNNAGVINSGILPADTTVADLAGKSFCFTIDEVTSGALQSEADLACPSFANTGTGGDPHFKTWKMEHFQYHGQCDLVLTKDPHFANSLGLDIHIRTKLVRYWSYIKTAVIRIGNDILEVEGSSMEVGVDKELHYWKNYEYQGELTDIAGFPVTVNADGTKLHKNRFEIDLDSVYPGQKIVIGTFKEFVKVDFINPTKEAFGNTVGMLGDWQDPWPRWSYCP